MPRIHRHDDARSFLERSEAWLLQHEAENNLILGLARSLVDSIEPYRPPLYWATVEEGEEVVGSAFRTPPFKLGLTRMPSDALPALAADAADLYDAIPGILGPQSEARAVAEEWARLKSVGIREGMRQRIYQLDQVLPPAHDPPGRLRPATASDLPLLTEWLAGFAADAGVQSHDPATDAERFVSRGSIFFWEAERPMSMAGWAGRTPHGVRVSAVYTPPEQRGRGYATSTVAALSHRLLASGARFCFLYTNLANPTSNEIYQRIGYRPICDVVDYLVESPENS